MEVNLHWQSHTVPTTAILAEGSCDGLSVTGDQHILMTSQLLLVAVVSNPPASGRDKGWGKATTRLQRGRKTPGPTQTGQGPVAQEEALDST